jgi:glycosyltransferase involved in cell wall biosynthesis
VTVQSPIATVGVWCEAPRGSRWANEGMQRLLGFLIEGSAAAELPVVWRIVVPNWLAAEAEADLRSLKAVPGAHWTLYTPPRQVTVTATALDQPPIGSEEDIEPEWIRELAVFANTEVSVDGWLVLFPYFSGATLLSRRYAVILPDAIPYSFPLNWHPDHWTPAGWPAWRHRTARVIASADTVVTFSKHVAVDAAQRLFGLPIHRTTIVPHAHPDLRPHLACLPADGNRSTLSQSTAAGLLRAHAEARGWRHLVDFPFEHVDYVVVSTQDRQTKNVVAVVDAVAKLLRHEALNLKLLMTTPIHIGAPWTLLPGHIASVGLDLDVLSLPDLPRDVHAALYHGAALAIHPSFYEGGQAPFPFHEAVSVGTPCLIADGPHTKEFLGTTDAQGFVFDPYDPSSLATAIRAILVDRSAVLARQRALLAAMPARNWGDVAADYVSAALGWRITDLLKTGREFAA